MKNLIILKLSELSLNSLNANDNLEILKRQNNTYYSKLLKSPYNPISNNIAFNNQPAIVKNNNKPPVRLIKSTKPIPVNLTKSVNPIKPVNSKEPIKANRNFSLHQFF